MSKTKPNRRTRLPMFISIAAVILIGMYFWKTPKPNISESVVPGVETAKFPMRLSVDEIDDNRLLELVNIDCPITDEPDKPELSSAYHVVPLREADTQMRDIALEAVNSMFEKAKHEGIDNLLLSSGFRGYEEQKLTYTKSKDKTFVQPPNHSEHQTGLAADIYAMGVSESRMADSKEGKWLAENAWQFGFILRYPDGKQDITGIGYEPWHFRYIGKPHSWYCFENKMCFEEYIQFLKESGGYSASVGGKTYAVLYMLPQNGIISVPDNSNYSVSSDNTGGYIITAWE